MSGVCVCDCRSRNCERRAAISVGAKPAPRRRSKPRGAGVVVVVVVVAGVVTDEEGAGSSHPGWADGVGAREGCVEARAASASATSSDGVRASPIEQWM